MELHRKSGTVAALGLLLLALPCGSQEHPYLFLRKADLPALKQKAASPEFAPLYRRLLERCDRWLELPPIEPPAVASTAEDRSGRELSRARQAQGRIVSLAMAYLLTGKTAYAERAKKEMWSFTDVWKSWVDPFHGDAEYFDLMAGELSFAFGVAYDWLYDALTDEERAKIRRAMIEHGMRRYLFHTDLDRNPKARGRWWRGVNNWNAVCNGGALVGALALGKEYEQSEEVMARARKGMSFFFDHLKDPGGWDEGTGYWHYGFRYALMAYAALEAPGRGDDGAGASLDVDGIFGRPGVRNTGYFPVYFCPGQVFCPSFGDSPGQGYDPVLYLLGARYKDDNFLWYADLHKPARPDSEGWPDEAFVLLWRPAGIRPKADLAYAKVFEDIGWAVFVDQWPQPQIIAGFKAGDLGVSHTHLDNNAIQLWAYGDFLLVDFGSGIYNRRYFGGDRWQFYEITTAGHNAVLINGKGQAPRTQGLMGRLSSDGGCSRLTGDATADYAAPEVRRAQRTILFCERRFFVLVDEVELQDPGTVQALWHAYTEPRLSQGKATFAGQKGAVDMVWQADTAVEARLEFDPGKATRSPNLKPDWRLEVRTGEAPHHTLVTLLAPRPARSPAAPLEVGRDAHGWRLRIGDAAYRLTLEQNDWVISRGSP